MKRFVIPLAILASAALAQDEPETPVEAENTAPVTDEAPAPAPAPVNGEPGVRAMSGMSILGNEEAPKSLVIVPWKSSKRGDGLDVANALDETPRPVDREVFARELRYYHLRTGDSE